MSLSGKPSNNRTATSGQGLSPHTCALHAARLLVSTFHTITASATISSMWMTPPRKSSTSPASQMISSTIAIIHRIRATSAPPTPTGAYTTSKKLECHIPLGVSILSMVEDTITLAIYGRWVHTSRLLVTVTKRVSQMGSPPLRRAHARPGPAAPHRYSVHVWQSDQGRAHISSTICLPALDRPRHGRDVDGRSGNREL